MKENLKKQKREQAKEEKKRLKWQNSKYESKSVVLNPNLLSDLGELSSREFDVSVNLDEEEDLMYVTGDATIPQGSEFCDAIIINCVDNSGKFGSGGFFFCS